MDLFGYIFFACWFLLFRDILLKILKQLEDINSKK